MTPIQSLSTVISILGLGIASPCWPVKHTQYLCGLSPSRRGYANTSSKTPFVARRGTAALACSSASPRRHHRRASWSQCRLAPAVSLWSEQAIHERGMARRTWQVQDERTAAVGSGGAVLSRWIWCVRRHCVYANGTDALH